MTSNMSVLKSIWNIDWSPENWHYTPVQAAPVPQAATLLYTKAPYPYELEEETLERPHVSQILKDLFNESSYNSPVMEHVRSILLGLPIPLNGSLRDIPAEDAIVGIREKVLSLLEVMGWEAETVDA